MSILLKAFFGVLFISLNSCGKVEEETTDETLRLTQGTCVSDNTKTCFFIDSVELDSPSSDADINVKLETAKTYTIEVDASVTDGFMIATSVSTNPEDTPAANIILGGNSVKVGNTISLSESGSVTYVVACTKTSCDIKNGKIRFE